MQTVVNFIDNDYIDVVAYNNNNNDTSILATATISSQQPIIQQNVKKTIEVEIGTLSCIDIPICTRQYLNSFEIGVSKGAVQKTIKLTHPSVWFDSNTLNNGRVYSIEHFLELVNKALRICASDVAIGFPVNKSPYFCLKNNAFSLIVHDDFIGSGSNEIHNVCMNSFAYHILGSGFYTFYDNTKPLGARYLIKTRPQFVNVRYGGLDLLQEFYSTFSTVSNLYEFNELLLVTNLPIKTTLSSAHLEGYTQQEQILTTFKLINQNLKSDILIQPNRHREITINPSSAIYSFYLKLKYKSRMTGKSYDLTMVSNAHMAIMLRLKTIS